MVEIVHLQKRQQPPANRKILLIDCLPGKGPRITHSKRGLVIWTSVAAYPEVIAEATREAERTGTRTIYVRGAPGAS